MKTIYQLITGIALPLTLCAIMTMSCYEDKGHYDYTPLRKLTLLISPDDFRRVSDNEIVYTYDQPTGNDTLAMTYRVDVTDGEQPVDSNEVVCSWVSLTNRTDTLYARTLPVKIQPSHPTDTFFLMKLHDKLTDLDYYQRVRIKTVLPYINNWFVLHTQDGQVKLGNAVRKGTDIIKTRSMILTPEAPDSALYAAFTANKVTDFNYLQMGYGYRDAALINILAGDELYAYFPFNPQAQLRGWYSQMMPRNSEEKVVTAFTDGSQLGGLITDGKKVLYSPGYRIYYPLKCAAGTENYQADFATYFEKKLYIWDNGQKKIFLFNTRDNTKLTGLTRVRMDMYNVAMLTELEPLLFTGERSLKDMTLVTALGNTWDDKNTYIDFIFRRSNNTYVRYSLYTNSVGGKELPKMEVSLLPYLVLDEGSRIIVSREYPNQYFVTRENSLYIYNLSTDEFDLIYEGPAGSYIQDIQFKTNSRYDDALMKLYEEDYPLENTLGIAFNLPNGTGEVHELLLEKSGDVKSVYKMDGFGTISKLVFVLSEAAY